VVIGLDNQPRRKTLSPFFSCPYKPQKLKVDDMTETVQIILVIIILVLVFIMAKRLQGIKINRAFKIIISDLKDQKAFDPSSAVTLPYASPVLFRIGLRDYRPRAITYLVQSGIVGMTEQGRFYLKQNVSEGPDEAGILT
jgi:hypothetical protein